MTFLQNLWRDLVDKRLWPVAAILLAAAIAVPFVIDTGSVDPEAEALTPVAAPSSAPATRQVAVAVTPAAGSTSRDGSSRDPFKPLVFAKAEKAAAVTGTAAPGAAPTPPAAPPSGGSTGASPSPSPSSSGGKTPPSSRTTPTPTPATQTPTTTTTRRMLAYELSVRVGRHNKIKSRRGLKPITYLPSRAVPLVALLGFTAEGARAVFVVSDDVVVSGSGRRCVGESQTACKMLELGPRDSVVLGRRRKDGKEPTFYRLTVSSISLKVQREAASAKASSRGAGASPTLGPAQWLEQVTRTTG